MADIQVYNNGRFGNVHELIEEAIRVANRLDQAVETEFNRHTLVATPGIKPDAVYRQYRAQLMRLPAFATEEAVKAAECQYEEKIARERAERGLGYRETFDQWLEEVVKRGVWRPGEVELQPGDTFLLKQGRYTLLVRVDDTTPTPGVVLARVGEEWQGLASRGSWASQVVDDPELLRELVYADNDRRRHWQYPFVREG